MSPSEILVLRRQMALCVVVKNIIDNAGKLSGMGRWMCVQPIRCKQKSWCRGRVGYAWRSALSAAFPKGSANTVHYPPENCRPDPHTPLDIVLDSKTPTGSEELPLPQVVFDAKKMVVSATVDCSSSNACLMLKIM